MYIGSNPVPAIYIFRARKASVAIGYSVRHSPVKASTTEKACGVCKRKGERIMVYLTSDLHLFHDRGFIYNPRGFSSVEKMDVAVMFMFSEVKANDDIYILGDIALGKDLDKIKEVVSSIPGRLHIITGNHDTSAKIAMYRSLPNVVEVVYATMIEYKSRSFYLSHYPTLTADLYSNPNKCVINLHGHLHVSEVFYEDRPYMYNVSVDANGMKLLTLDKILEKFKQKVQECYKLL